MFMFCRELCFNKIPVINLAGKSDQQLIWEAIGYSEWKANLTLIKCASGNNSCSHTYREREYTAPSKHLKLEMLKKKKQNMLFLKNEKVFKQLWMNTFDKINLLKRQLKPQLALAH